MRAPLLRTTATRVASVAIVIAAGLASTATTAWAASTSHAAPCSWSGLQQRLETGGTYTFKDDCHLAIKETLTVDAVVSLSAGGHVVTLDGLDPNGLDHHQVLNVGKDASLTMSGITVSDGASTGGAPTPGTTGSDGDDASTLGATGEAALPGGRGSKGLPAIGGGMFVSTGASVVLTDVTFKGNTVTAGPGGDGGTGGHGGNGADSSGPATAGGAGGVGGNGGKGARGGLAIGGAIYNLGSLSITGGSFLNNLALGGPGGTGGDGHPGGVGGDVTCSSDPCNGLGGAAGHGGDGGLGGNGGDALGGAIYSGGTLSLLNTTFTSNSAVAGPAGDGGAGADGSDAGCNATTTNCGTNSPGADGGAGGNGGNAVGGAVVARGPAVAKTVTYTDSDVEAATVSCPGSGCGGIAGLGDFSAPGSAGANGQDGKNGPADALIEKDHLRPIFVSTSSLKPGQVSTAYHAQLHAKGGIAPYSFGCKHLPKGLHCSKAGLLSGTPKRDGTTTIRVSVRDPFAAKVSSSGRKLHLTITAVPHK